MAISREFTWHFDKKQLQAIKLESVLETGVLLEQNSFTS